MFNLKINNFRGFQNQSFQFSKVNILIGENSAGKSSVLKFFRVLKQSLTSRNRDELNLTFSGDDVDLGNYKEVIYNHETDRKLSFSLELGEDFRTFLSILIPRNMENVDSTTASKTAALAFIENNFSKKIIDPVIVEFKLSKDLNNPQNLTTIISNEQIGRLTIVPQSLSDEHENLLLPKNQLKCDCHFEMDGERYDFKNISYDQNGFIIFIRANDVLWQHFPTKHEDDGKVMIRMTILFTALQYIAMETLRFSYVNPLLSEPAKRVYYESDSKPSIIRDIKDMVAYLDANDKEGTLQTKLGKILSDFGIADKIYLKKDGSVRELRIISKGIDNNITDVGFGLSLQLPILTQAILADSKKTTLQNIVWHGSTLLIEQPEVHLHPKLQAKFIDALLSVGNNNTYFIETHSEHIVRMLQILVKEQRYNLKAEDVTIHYFRKVGKDMVTTFHQIHPKTGKLSPSFPKGFYDASYHLAFQLLD